MSARILLIDDNKSVAELLHRLLQDEGFQPETVLDSKLGLERATREDFDVVVTDLQMPGPLSLSKTQGLEVIDHLHRVKPHLPVILMTGFHTTETAIQATKLGAFDYILKPINPSEFLHLVRSAANNKQVASERVGIGECGSLKKAIIGKSALMQEVYKEIGRVAERPVTVLIRGETGTGKELVARALYQHGGREDKPFIVVNCASLPETLLESELFGHEAGAFTDARLRRIGRFEQAHRGTLFLDEIGDMAPGTQVKLLRVLQEKTIQRLGARETLPVDVRILAATHRNLEAAVAEKGFRSDLYFRIQEAVIRLPSLRDRTEDIPDLIRYFVGCYASEQKIATPHVEPAALEFLRLNPWPGNVRQLRSTIQQAIRVTGGRPITEDVIKEVLSQTVAHPQPVGTAWASAPGDTLDGASAKAPFTMRIAQLLAPARSGGVEKVEAILTEEAERELYDQAMRLAGGNQTQVARWLGVSRPTVREKLNMLGLQQESNSARRPEPAKAEPRLLIVEDDDNFAELLRRGMEQEGYQTEVTKSVEEALPRATRRNFDVVLTDLYMGHVGSMSGLDLVEKLHTSAPHLPVILMTGQHTTEIAIQAIKLGAYDYFAKPDASAFTPSQKRWVWVTQLAEILQRAAASKLATEAVELPEDTPIWEEKRDRILGRSRGMREVYKEIGRLAATAVTVLIRGETGTGKELVARALYQHGGREDQPFIAVNCAAIPETLLESELFGHEAGAFTGARSRRIGRFEQANHGTIFLDEIGDMSLATQAKLLRVLQEKTIQPLAGKDPIALDVRILAATHRDLEAAIAAGQFRSDLYFRLGEAVIRLPPLRERAEDLAELAGYFVQRDGIELGWPTSTLTAEGLRYLQEQPWPGNVRELRNVIRRAVLLARGYAITPQQLQKALNPVTPSEPPVDRSAAAHIAQLLDKAKKGEVTGIESILRHTLETDLYSQAIALAEGDQSQAARWLGVSRPTMRDKLTKYGLFASTQFAA